jgi:hypothetical protein
MMEPTRKFSGLAGCKLLACLALPLVTGCWAKTQRYPAPMLPEVEPLPPGTTDLYPAGPEEAIVTRMADPVFARRPGEASSFPLYYYRKQVRLNAGSWVFCGAGGRVEILYPEGTSITLFGRGAGVIGSESRGEPLFFLRECDRVVLTLAKGQQVRMLGGAVLTAEGGPIALEHMSDNVMRVTNRSLAAARVAYRDQVFLLDPAEVVHLPVLDSGTGPMEQALDFRTVQVAGQPVQLRGAVELIEDPRGTRLKATGEHEVLALGLRLRLDPGDEVLLSDLSARAPELLPGPGPAEPPGGEPAAEGDPEHDDHQNMDMGDSGSEDL